MKAFIFYRNFNSKNNILFKKYSHFFYSFQLIQPYTKIELEELNKTQTFKSLIENVEINPRLIFLKKIIKDFENYLQKPIEPIKPSDIPILKYKLGIKEFHIYLPLGEKMLLESQFLEQGVIIKRVEPLFVKKFNTFNDFYNALKVRAIDVNVNFKPKTVLEKELFLKMTEYKKHISLYAEHRTKLSSKNTSNLSPYYALGVCSFEQILTFYKQYLDTEFFRQLSWILYCKLKYEDIPKWNISNKLSMFEEWLTNKLPSSLVNDWVNEQMVLLKKGQMLSNRTRLIISAHFIRDLGNDWNYGELFFRNFLIDGHTMINRYNWYAQSKNRFLKNYNIPLQLKKFA